VTETKVVVLRQTEPFNDPLTEILRSGAKRLTAQAVKAELEAFLSDRADKMPPAGRRRVVRHGHDPVRRIQTVGDAALGFCKALDEAFPTTQRQRRWFHKSGNVLNTSPKSLQLAAHQDLREIRLSPRRAVRTKGALSQDTARPMVFKLVTAASKNWRRLQGQNQLPKIISGGKFRDGIEAASETKSAA